MASAGRLDFRPIGPWGIWLPTGRTSSLSVSGARAEPGRRPGWRSVWSISPMLHIVILDTADGELELAAQAHEVARLLTLLHGSSDSGSPHVG